MAASNKEKIGRGLEFLCAGLKPFVEAHMRASLPSGKDWVEVLAARDGGARGGPVGTSADDPRFLLKVITENRSVFREHLTQGQMSYASELRDVGNRWAHEPSISGDDAGRALDTMERLLTAVGAGPQAEQVGKLRLDHQRAQFEELTRRSARAAVGTVSTPGTGLKPWREVVTPHRDVIEGQFNAAEYAADLHQVATGQALQREYTDPVEFFDRTYLTEALKDLLSRAVRRISGDANASPVVNLQTTFGGGKTHSMLALYHLFCGLPATSFPQAVQEIVGDVPLQDLKVTRVTLVGTHLSPNQPLIKDDGTRVNTLWGDLAWQVGGRAAYDRVAQSDATGTPPGDVLADLLREHTPVLIEIDEWVAYARGLYGQDGLAGGSFDNQFTFAQHLTEAVRAIPGAMLVVSIPASDDPDRPESGSELEVGGANGRAALDRLRHVVGRTADPWRPAQGDESFEIVKRRLFAEPDAGARAEIAGMARQFVTFYRENSGQFPRDAESVDYEKRIVSAYPIHPELFDRLYGDWSTLEKFQRTRGVLRLMSTVIHALWTAEDASPLITPGTVPIHVPNVFNELRQYLPDTWNSVVDNDVDGEGSTPVRIDDERPTFGARALTRRIARTIFLASAPTRGTAHRGAEKPRVWLGVAIPGDTLGNFGSALEMLGQRATYLYSDAGRFWYDTTASVTRTAADFADRLRDEPETVWKEIIRRLRGAGGSPGSAGGAARDGFAAVTVAPESEAGVADAEDARLVVLHPRYAHIRGDVGSQAMQFSTRTLLSAGSGQRVRRNTVVFAAADAARYEELDAAVREYLAWAYITSRATEMDLTAQQSAQAATRRAQADQAVDARIAASYVWALVPEQPDAAAPPTVVAEKFPEGPKPIAARIAGRLERDGTLAARYGPIGIRLALNGPLASAWDSGHITVGELWDHYTRYPYLDRLRDRSVLVGAIRSFAATVTTWFQEGFAIASGYEPAGGGSNGPSGVGVGDVASDATAGHYVGLVLPGDAGEPTITDGTLLVKPSIAQAQRDATREAAQTTAHDPGNAAARGESQSAGGPGTRDGARAGGGPAPGGSDGDGSGPTSHPKGRDPAPPAMIANARYRARATVDPGRDIATQLGTLAREVLDHLVGSNPNVLDIVVEIAAEKIDGFDERVVRTVTENGRTLGLSGNRFEDV